MKNMTPEQTQIGQTGFERAEPTTDATAREASIRTVAPASRTLKRRETGMKSEDNYVTLTGRFATTLVTLAMLIGLLFLTGTATSAAVITVTGAGDTIAVDGLVTLREAITAANTNAASGDALAGDAGLDVINFNISGNGVQTINLTSALPTITDPLTIDGYSQQPCSSNSAPCSKPNTLAVGSDAVLLIELNGTNAGASATGLLISAGNSTIKGLIINRFGLFEIDLITNGGNTIAGNYVGMNSSGTSGFPSPGGVGILVQSPNNTIGGMTPADRNVTNHCEGSSIALFGNKANGNKVSGNYLGTDASGMNSLFPNRNKTGLRLSDCKSNIVGGTTPAERNVISGGGGYGIDIGGNANNNQVMGNFIGTKADGISPLKNNQGGVLFSNTASDNILGGITPGAGNVIAFNNSFAVFVDKTAHNDAILGNSMGGKIELFPSGGTNDNNTGDADTGANNLQNFPVLTSAVSNGATTTIQGTLDSAFSTQFRVEFFSNFGMTFLGFANVTTDASGKAGFTFNVPTANVVGKASSRPRPTPTAIRHSSRRQFQAFHSIPAPCNSLRLITLTPKAAGRRRS